MRCRALLCIRLGNPLTIAARVSSQFALCFLLGADCFNFGLLVLDQVPGNGNSDDRQQHDEAALEKSDAVV